jgi:hypothetical protein
MRWSETRGRRRMPFVHRGPPRGLFLKRCVKIAVKKQIRATGKCLPVMGLSRIALNFSRKDLARLPCPNDRVERACLRSTICSKAVALSRVSYTNQACERESISEGFDFGASFRLRNI